MTPEQWVVKWETQEIRDACINYQQHLHVTAIDIDPKCVHMAYVQFALLHIRRSSFTATCCAHRGTAIGTRRRTL